ncbi:MAG: diguanylate cyclase domain-containing protein [Acidobacteriaceae bacterium]
MPSSLTSEPPVLVATEDAALGLQLADVLQKLGYSVQSADSGAAASAYLLGHNPPEVALLADSLPGQSGLELAAELKRRSGRKQSWLVLLSDTANPLTVAAAADAGVDDLLLCPAGEPVSETELRIRLSVAGRMQQLSRQLQEQSQTVTSRASHDQLTGLWNRESLLSLLFPETDRVQRMSTQLAFLLLDIDSFTRVNEEYGYDAGDKILHELANRLRRYMRSYDLLGRVGGDEFLLALPGCNSHQARHLASRIRTLMLRRPFDAGRDYITLTASIGLSQSRGRSPLVVLREAERALATAKLEGRNCEREHTPPRQNQAFLKEQPV